MSPSTPASAPAIVVLAAGLGTRMRSIAAEGDASAGRPADDPPPAGDAGRALAGAHRCRRRSGHAGADRRRRAPSRRRPAPAPRHRPRGDGGARGARRLRRRRADRLRRHAAALGRDAARACWRRAAPRAIPPSSSSASVPPIRRGYGRLVAGADGTLEAIVEAKDAEPRRTGDRPVQFRRHGGRRPPAVRPARPARQRQRQGRVLPHRHRRAGPRRMAAPPAASKAMPPNCSASTAAPNWRPPKRSSRRGCAPRRWRRARR